MRFATAISCLTVAGACLLGTATAQTPAPSDLPTIFTFAAPPQGFNALTASASDLATYGFPPRPSPLGKGAVSYAAWARVMSAARTHIDPQIRMTDHRHVPAIGLTRRLSVQGAPVSAGAMTSTNWSGQALTNGASSFGSGSFSEVMGQWVVSAVQEPVGTCSGTDVSATWVGIDGVYGSSTDVLQAGTEGDTACSNGVTTQNFYPWFEWYPDYEYEITNFIEFRGASIFVVVHATSATSGVALFVNLQTGAFTNVGISAPAGTSLKGNSAEWIVERPSIGQSQTIGTLADFGMIGMTSELAFLASNLSSGNYNGPGAPGAGQTSDTITMLNSAGATLSNPSPQGATAQFIYAAGPTQ